MTISLELDPAKVSTPQRVPTLVPRLTFEIGQVYDVDDAVGQQLLALPGGPFRAAARADEPSPVPEAPQPEPDPLPASDETPATAPEAAPPPEPTV